MLDFEICWAVLLLADFEVVSSVTVGSTSQSDVFLVPQLATLTVHLLKLKSNCT